MLQMGRIFVGLAFWNIVLFGVTIWLGVTHHSAHWQHQAMGVLTGIYTCLTHSIVLMHFMGSGKAIKEAVETYSLPVDYARRTRKFKARTSGLATLSCVLTIIAVWVGGAKDVGLSKGMAHAWLAYATVAFNLYSFWVEYGVIQENTQMIREIDAKIAGQTS